MYIVLALFLLLSACVTPVTQTPSLNQMEIREEAKKQAAVAAEDKLRRQEATMREHLAMQERLVRVAIPIARAGSQLCSQLFVNAGICVYDFVLSTDEGVNASADGKQVKVNISMMRFVKTDDELAVVLGHELAHNMMGHIAAQQKNAYTGAFLGMMVDTFAASQGIKTKSAFAKNGALAATQSYSPAFEKEADYVGLYIMALAGYDINAAPNFWRKMSIKNPDAITISTTHPTTPERTIMLEKTIVEIMLKQEQNLPLVPEIAVRTKTTTPTTGTTTNPYRMTIE